MKHIALLIILLFTVVIGDVYSKGKKSYSVPADSILPFCNRPGYKRDVLARHEELEV